MYQIMHKKKGCRRSTCTMATNRRTSLAMMAKMRRMQQKRKGKQKTMWVDCEEGKDETSFALNRKKSLDKIRTRTSARNRRKSLTKNKRKSSTMMTKMRRLQQKRKGKQKVSWSDSRQEIEIEIENDNPLVTFIEKKNDSDKNHKEGAIIATATNALLSLDPVQFYLEDGRLDVAEVFDHLNTSRLQYESKPGVWQDLKGLKSGKSTNKFKNMQEVYFRKTGLSNWWPWKSQGKPWVDTWLVEGDTRKTYCARVSRLCYDNKKGVVGTAVRFENPYGLVLTAHHCCTMKDPQSGLTIPRKRLFAFDTPVEVVHFSHNYDLAFLLLKSGPYVGGFHFATRDEEKRGRKVRMISFPWHVDKAYGFDHANVVPTEVYGHIANLGPKERKLPLFVDALATYMGGFAASPGGAVTFNSKVLAGIHVRAIWHQMGEKILPFKGNGKNKNSCQGEQHLRAVSRTGSYFDSQEYEFEEPPNYKESCTKKKRKMSELDNNGGGGYTCHPESSRALELQGGCKQVSVVNSQLTKNKDVKCSMYHGYLSTYLSTTRIEQEYNEFVNTWINE